MLYNGCTKLCTLFYFQPINAQSTAWSCLPLFNEVQKDEHIASGRQLRVLINAGWQVYLKHSNWFSPATHMNLEFSLRL